MLKGELGENEIAHEPQPLTYGSYLRVPELLGLQSPLKQPAIHDEMLFIIVQQAQELWFKQVLHELRAVIGLLERDQMASVVRVYDGDLERPDLFMLAEALSEYEVTFSEWRFRHVKLVERTIGDRMPGTAGSSGVGYLGKTMSYRFFPELWEARNQITARAKR